jgi:hypothetical protein
MSLVSRLFKSSQVKDCQAALKLLRPVFQDALFYDSIEKRVADIIIRNPDAVQKKMLIDGQSAQAVVLLTISNMAFKECATGRNHVYRGVLSMEGNSFRQVFSIAQSKLLEIGVIDEDDVDEGRSSLAAGVKEAG